MLFGPGFAPPAQSAPQNRKAPMHFTFHPRIGLSDCEPQCNGVIEAVGLVTGDTPAAFEKLASAHDLRGAMIVLNSGGGSVLDTLTLGRRWRALGVTTTVGVAVPLAGRRGENDKRIAIRPQANCESMCAFLLLAGEQRSVPSGARVRVHQIWMGDRADDAKSASYNATDMTTVQRDVGRLAQYTFEMGGSGSLLALALSVPPWEPLHELSADELVAANLITGADGQAMAANAAAQGRTKAVTERFESDPRNGDAATVTAEAGRSASGSAVVKDHEPAPRARATIR